MAMMRTYTCPKTGKKMVEITELPTSLGFATVAFPEPGGLVKIMQFWKPELEKLRRLTRLDASFCAVQ